MGIIERFRRRKSRSAGTADVDQLVALLESQELPGRRAIADRFHITEHEFNTLYVSYHFSLLMSGGTSSWNIDVDDLAREMGALSEQEIAHARTSLHQAVLNRIKLRLLVNSRQAPPTSASDSKTMQEKAQLLVQVASWAAISSYASMADRFPELRRFKNIHNWDFFLTTAIVASCVFHLQMALDTDEAESIQLKIAEQLVGIHPQGWDAISDLVGFIDRAEKPVMPPGTLTDRKVARVLNEIHERMAASIGGWVVWNLKGNAPAEPELALLSAVGRFCYEGIGEELTAEFTRSGA